MLDNDFLEKIKRIKRSPKLGDIYEIYRKEQLIAVKENTMLRQNRVYEKYLSVIANTRVDRFQPLIICKQILQSCLSRKQIYNLFIYCKASR